MLLKVPFVALCALSMTTIAGTGAWAESDTTEFSPYEMESILDGEYAEAEKALHEQLAANPDDPFVMLNLAVIYQKTGREDQAVAFYEQVLDQRGNPYATMATGKPARVKTVARKALAELTAE